MKIAFLIGVLSLSPSLAVATDICYLFEIGSPSWVQCKEQARGIEQDRAQVRDFSNQLNAIMATEQATIQADENHRFLQALVAAQQARQN